MQDEWNLGHAGRIGYLDAIAELGDFRKVNGASESVLRGLSCTELYLKKVHKTVSKMMRLQWTSELDIDPLEAKGHWTTLEELGSRGATLAALRKRAEVMQGKSRFDIPACLIFCYQISRRISPYMSSRPMTYQYLTVEMVNKAKTNGGFTDQKMFKKAGKYGFDSLYLTETSMQVLDG